jgi:hypothetical protein
MAANNNSSAFGPTTNGVSKKHAREDDAMDGTDNGSSQYNDSRPMKRERVSIAVAQIPQ